MGESPSQSQSMPPTTLEAVVDPVRIVALIQRLVAERLFVTVQLSDSPDSYNSTILGLEPESTAFILDELYPQEGNAVLRSQRWLRLRASFDNSALTFTSEIVGEGENAGIRFFRVALPTRVDYAQRRSFHRVPVELYQEVPVMFETADQETVIGSLHDISATGLSIRVSGATPAIGGGAVPYCMIRVPDEEPIVSAIEIRDRREDGDGVIFGARFVELDRLTERRIERFVAAADRILQQHRDENT